MPDSFLAPPPYSGGKIRTILGETTAPFRVFGFQFQNAVKFWAAYPL